MSPPALTVELQSQADGRIEVQTKNSQAGEATIVVSPPFSQPIQRQAVALALEAVRFEPTAWQSVPPIFQALKDLGLGNDSGFTSLRERIGRALFEAFFPPGDLREALRASLNAATAKAPARIELSFQTRDAEIGVRIPGNCCTMMSAAFFSPTGGRRSSVMSLARCPCRN